MKNILNKVTLGGSDKLIRETSDSVQSIGKGVGLLAKPFIDAKKIWNKSAKSSDEAKQIRAKLIELGITEDQMKQLIGTSMTLDVKSLLSGKKMEITYVGANSNKQCTKKFYPITAILFEVNNRQHHLFAYYLDEELLKLENALRQVKASELLSDKKGLKQKAADFVGLKKDDYILLGKSALAITLAVCIIKENFVGKDFVKSFMTQLAGSSAGKKTAEYLSSGIKSLGKAGGFLESVAEFTMRNKSAISKFVILFSALKLIKLADKSINKNVKRSDPLDIKINDMCESIGRYIIEGKGVDPNSVQK